MLKFPKIFKGELRIGCLSTFPLQNFLFPQGCYLDSKGVLAATIKYGFSKIYQVVQYGHFLVTKVWIFPYDDCMFQAGH